MSWLSTYLKSSVGAKHVMALTGIALVGFVLVHMIGNLAVFAGRDALNGYAETLKGLGGILWAARLGLLAMFVIHIAAAMRLTVLNRAARPNKYHMLKARRSAFYARVMPWSGLIVLSFVVFHLLHFTLGAIQPDHFAMTQDMGGGETRHDVYGMVVSGFQVAPVAIAYVIAMALLCMHLAHGVTSMFQSLGLHHPKYNSLIRNAGPAFATLVFVGNSAMPLAVLLGAVTL